ncbi:hypothetical protein CYMTET_51530 [Cymbomonas tetramitiformis]|uniref:Photosynthesis system II assembly factor Ycf48/Hcf136-like domain-containing protein n=1 Tax=Cymbomonas tetramitiformis TaxID=36881 RepID=A0AAE0BM35_9CHLO|nr:hypothetical protein CYMTET_51530 [Cymbomonas tetramitiformis]
MQQPPGGRLGAAGTGTTAEILNGINFASSNTGWVVGRRGTILKTTDFGITWTPSTYANSNTWYGVSFASEALGWVVGHTRSILFTADGGVSYAPQSHNFNVGDGKIFYAVQALDERTAYVVGDSGAILYTSNAGGSWTIQDSGWVTPLYDVFFVSATR